MVTKLFFFPKSSKKLLPIFYSILCGKKGSNILIPEVDSRFLKCLCS